MANIKSQIKRAGTNETRRIRNVSYKTAIKTSIKNVVSAIEAKDKAAASAAFVVATKKLDQSVSKGIHHKNYVSRQKSRLASAINAIA